MKTKVVATSALTQKFEFTAETDSEIAGLKAFERVLQTASAITAGYAFYQADAKTLNVTFTITPEEFAAWQAVAKK
jgi:hypothetical protein